MGQEAGEGGGRREGTNIVYVRVRRWGTCEVDGVGVMRAFFSLLFNPGGVGYILLVTDIILISRKRQCN